MINVIIVGPMYHLIDYLLKRRSMFDIEDLRSLRQFLQGYEFALKSNGMVDEDLVDFEGFGLFVSQAANVDSLTNWADILTAQSKTKNDSFDLFQRKLNEYRESRSLRNKLQ